MNIFARGIITAAALALGAGSLNAQDFILQAHRGLSNKFPENTSLSFFEAAKIPVYKGMETDVSMTKDGVLVCMHDSKLDRTTNGTDTLWKYTMEELQELWIDGGYGWNDKYKETLRIPTFETYLEACKLGGFTPYVELKWVEGEGIRKTIKALHDFGFDGNYVLTSFKWDNILTASTMTDAPLEFMKGRFTKEMIDTCAAKVKNLVIRPKSTNVTQELVDYCHSKGIPVECYGIPVGRTDLVKKLISMGVRGGTCNDWEGLGLDGNLSSQSYPQWLDSAAIYHIYPSSFKDSDGDGYGDLEGIRSKLDYVKDLGFNTIWISPVFCSEFEDGGYDITDYYKIDPRFGTNSDLVRLVDEAHSKGLKVCLDLVAGHTSDKHPWFVESANGDRNGHYADYYLWTDASKADVRKSEKKKWVAKEYPRGKMYMKNYYDVQPALNYGYLSPDPSKPWEQSYDAPGPRMVRQELKNIISFWFDKGVDGFRCDLAWSLVKGDDKEFNGVRRLWNEIFSWTAANYPDRIFLSEWSSPVESISCGFDIDIIRHNGCGTTMYRDLVYNTERGANRETGIYPPKDCWFDKSGKGQIASFVVPFEEMYNKTLGHGFPCMPTSSHDTWRMNRNQRSTPEELKVMMTFFLTMPWVPIVYYGEEIGMRSMDGVPAVEGSRDRSAERTPMQWSDGPTAGFSTCDPAKLYLPVDESPSRPTVEKEINDPASIYSWTKGLLALRASVPALGNTGGWKYISDLQQPYPAVYERFSDDGKYLVIVNPRSEKASAEVSGYKKLEVVYGDPKALSVKKVSGGLSLRIKGVSSVICKVTE